jgi:TctA family transporter
MPLIFDFFRAYRQALIEEEGNVTVFIERYLTYIWLLYVLYIRLSFSPFFLYIALSLPFTPLVPYL